MDIFNNSSMQSVHKALDAAQLRQHIVANNIANATTPGYKKSSVKFEEYLENALDRKGITGFRTDTRHISIGAIKIEHVAPRVIMHRDSKINNNNNNVDIDAEMTELAKTQIWYDALSKNMNGKFSKLRMVIGGK